MSRRCQRTPTQGGFKTPGSTRPGLAYGHLFTTAATAATVGCGDIVPSTPATKIFSVFLVMLGFGVLSRVTAEIATRWIETEERIIEREILRDVHRQIDALHQEIVALRRDLAQVRGAAARQPLRGEAR